MGGRYHDETCLWFLCYPILKRWSRMRWLASQKAEKLYYLKQLHNKPPKLWPTSRGPMSYHRALPMRARPFFLWIHSICKSTAGTLPSLPCKERTTYKKGYQGLSVCNGTAADGHVSCRVSVARTTVTSGAPIRKGPISTYILNFLAMLFPSPVVWFACDRDVRLYGGLSCCPNSPTKRE